MKQTWAWHCLTRLALSYAGVIAVILGLAGFSMYRFLIQSSWKAIAKRCLEQAEREMESIAIKDTGRLNKEQSNNRLSHNPRVRKISVIVGA